jgi:hypothetical protein
MVIGSVSIVRSVRSLPVAALISSFAVLHSGGFAFVGVSPSGARGSARPRRVAEEGSGQVRTHVALMRFGRPFERIGFLCASLGTLRTLPVGNRKPDVAHFAARMAGVTL